MKEAKKLIQEELDLLFECPLIQDKELNYTKKRRTNSFNTFK